MGYPKSYVRFMCLVGLVISFVPAAEAQRISKFDSERVLSMLDDVSKDIQKHYYDPKFHGVDWEATVRETKEKIKTAPSLNLGLAHLAAAVVSLNDSHTFFLPPSRPYKHNYGYQLKMIGEHCYITRVRPKTDAEAKGVKPGDEVVAENGFGPNRDILWKMNYRFNVLRPEPMMQLALRDVEGLPRQVEVMAKFHELARLQDVTGDHIWDVIRDEERDEHLQRARWAQAGDSVGILKLPVFMFDRTEVFDMIGKARKHPALIVDLRENPGGAVDTLKDFLGGIFEDEVKIADRVGRKESKPEIAKSSHHNIFTGKLVVLVDSDSASAAELFARVVQIQKRGVVVGDRTSGSVMEAKRYSYSQGAETKVFYGAEITESDLIMTDGKSLEHRGVTPDELLLPTAADLAAGRDPVMAHAAAMLGAKLSPEDAGKLFPYEWPPE